MSLADFASSAAHDGATLTVLNPDSEGPVYDILSGLFDDDAIAVRTATTEGGAVPSDAVLVEKDGGDSGFAVSSLESVRDELLLVNSDVYVTGSRALDDIDTPDAIRHLDELPFTVTGYPENPREKLLLIEISRHIEALAWRAGEGRLASGFQELSRLNDERGTRRVYARLGRDTAVDTHLYGVPDAQPSVPGVTVHARDDRELRRSWFVVYRSTHHTHEAAALIAVETRPHTWEGCWTYDAAKVDSALDYLDRTYD